MTDLTGPLGPMLVLDLETTPDPAAVAIAGHENQIKRNALHRIAGFSALAVDETEPGKLGGFRLLSGADGDELSLIKMMLGAVSLVNSAGGGVVTYNGLHHDLPVLRQRIKANWAFDLEGASNLDSVPHIDLMRFRPSNDHHPNWSLRDACAGLGIPLDHRAMPQTAHPLPVAVRKSQNDVVAALLLLLHEAALARGSASTLLTNWRSLSDFLGERSVRGPHLEAFRLPAHLSP